MIIYNDNFINEYNEEVYLSYLRNPDKLNNFIILEKNRYDKNNIDGEVYLLKESLDHYVVKKIITDPNFQNTLEFKNYLNYMKRIMTCNYELSTNLFFSVFSKDKYQIWFADSFNSMQNIRKNNSQTFGLVYSKMKNNQIISQDELNIICTYFSKRRFYENENYKEKYSVLISYIFNVFVNNSNKYKFTPQILDAILNYAPIQYSLHLRNKKDFNPYNIRIIASDYLRGKEFLGPAISLSSENKVIMNRDFLNIKFDSISDSKVAYRKKGNDFTFLMIVLFHEMTHNYQNFLSKKPELNDNGLSYAISKILHKELHDYKDNHDNDDMEIFATVTGWHICRDFFQEHFPILQDNNKKSELLNNCKNNSIYTLARHSFAIKSDKENKLFTRDDYDFENLAKIIKNKPNYLNLFPCLKRFFNNEGEINVDICFYPNSLWENSIITKSFISYLLTNHKVELSKKIGDSKFKNSEEDFVRNVRDCIQRDIYAYLDTFNSKAKMGEYIEKKEFDKVQYSLLKKVIVSFETLESLADKIKNSNPKNTHTGVDVEISELKKDVCWAIFMYKYKELTENDDQIKLLQFLQRESMSSKYHSYHSKKILSEYQTLNQQSALEQKNNYL